MYFASIFPRKGSLGTRLPALHVIPVISNEAHSVRGFVAAVLWFKYSLIVFTPPHCSHSSDIKSRKRCLYIALSPDQWPGDEANVFTTTVHTFANTHLVPCIIIIIMCVQCTCVLLQIMYVI